MARDESEIAVLLVHGLKMSSELYAQAFSSRSRFRVVSSGGEISEAVRTVQEANVDVALISSHLKDGTENGLDALRQIRAASPSVKSVVLLDKNDGRLAMAAFRLGARGVFCPQIDGFDLLCRCVEQVHAGQVWANSAQLHLVLEDYSRCAPTQVVNAVGECLLTKREDEIVDLVQHGLTNRQIAAELGLSEHTIRNKLFQIFEKLGVSSRVELALYAINNSKQATSLRFLEGKKEVTIERPAKIRAAAV